MFWVWLGFGGVLGFGEEISLVGWFGLVLVAFFDVWFLFVLLVVVCLVLFWLRFLLMLVLFCFV